MRRYFYRFIILSGLLWISAAVLGQGEGNDSSGYYNEVRTYVNPVLPGDHPDPTLLRVGDDFYHCGSSFHFTPYLPVYHSKDLVHWEVISRVLSPSRAGFVTDRPSAGIWQGAITHFYNSFWIYFSAGGQWFCKAATPYGPWSAPEKVRTNAVTGDLGYDNSIFVDDDGKPYMVIKNGQKVNRIQALGRDGQLTDTAINLDWINARLQYSWAEGPVMCRRNGYYYYFPAGDVSGGQYVLRTRKLTSDSTAWERLGDFFKPVTDAHARFRRPNHISAPLQLADGSWWTLGQSYERADGDDWSGMGRQTSLYPVIWEGDRPWGMAPASAPVVIPGLSSSGIPWRSVHTDYFNGDTLGLWWHFLSRTAAGEYSLTARNGWVRLMPAAGRTHLVQKETDHYYTAVTRVDLDATDTADRAGIYLTNGGQTVDVRLYVGYDKSVFMRLDTAVRVAMNPVSGPVWLKLEREGHMLTGYYSSDGRRWVSLGAPVSAVALDKEQPKFNSWVGTSVGLFAEGKAADFDFFVCKDGFSPLAAVGYRNYYGVERVVTDRAAETVRTGAVTNTSSYGGWFMLSGVTMDGAAQVKALVSARKGGVLEIWLDDLKTGRMIARIPVTPTSGDSWEWQAAMVKGISGSHDVFVKFPPGGDHGIYVKQIVFKPAEDSARNPIIYADVPDMSMIRVGDTYYMSSTTMHMSPGLPIMKSKDLVNWELVSYAYDILDDVDELNLVNGKSTYGRGSWASSLRYHNGQFFVSTFSGTTGKTYIYTTKDIEKGPWKALSFKPSLHDHSLFFDDDGKAYMVYGSGRIMLAELSDDLSGIKPGTGPQPIIEDASSVAGPDIGLRAEGSQLFKINGKYYLFNIAWPKGGMRTVVIHRADRLAGPYEGRVGLQDKGVAQGGLINTPEGKWFAYLFRDYGSVGRVPYMAPVQWEDGWPVLGVDHRAPDTVALPAGKGLRIVASDEFDRRAGDRALPLVWQWNHNPDHRWWSLDQRPGYLRLTTGRVDTSILLARNTLTQRTFGPECSGVTALDVSHMKDGDRAGLLLLQKKYGWVGVKMEGGVRYIVMVREGMAEDSVVLEQGMVYLKADCNFRDRTDKALFYYSLDGKTWKPVGATLQMAYTLPHFMGYRYGLFNYATQSAGGYVDFDFFRIGGD